MVTTYSQPHKYEHEKEEVHKIEYKIPTNRLDSRTTGVILCEHVWDITEGSEKVRGRGDGHEGPWFKVYFTTKHLGTECQSKTSLGSILSFTYVLRNFSESGSLITYVVVRTFSS